MARRTRDVTVSAEGRDKGKVFHLTEMAAEPAEEWAMRIFLAITRAGIDLPDDLLNGGMPALQVALPGIIGGVLMNGIGRLEYDEIKPLLAQMMDCVQIKESVATRALTPDDIEEVGTRLFLRGEVFKLHVDFSKDAGQQA